MRGIPLTYNNYNYWDEEIDGLRWYVEWKEKDIIVNTVGRVRELLGSTRLNYFKTKRAAFDFIDERRQEKDYEWYRTPGWEELVAS